MVGWSGVLAMSGRVRPYRSPCGFPASRKAGARYSARGPKGHVRNQYFAKGQLSGRARPVGSEKESTRSSRGGGYVRDEVAARAKALKDYTNY